MIVVDWGNSSSPPYTQAVANIRLVAAVTAHLLSYLAESTPGRNLDRVHCIGHSLGAHLSGYIGYTLQKVSVIRSVSWVVAVSTCSNFNLTRGTDTTTLTTT